MIRAVFETLAQARPERRNLLLCVPWVHFWIEQMRMALFADFTVDLWSLGLITLSGACVWLHWLLNLRTSILRVYRKRLKVQRDLAREARAARKAPA